MEESARFLALIKLANVGLTLIWGFAVTYVFVRALPLREFQAFLIDLLLENGLSLQDVLRFQVHILAVCWTVVERVVELVVRVLLDR